MLAQAAWRGDCWASNRCTPAEMFRNLGTVLPEQLTHAVQDAADADAAAEAILAHMEYALAHRLSDMPGRPEQLTVVLDSRGAPTLQVRPSHTRSPLLRRSRPAGFPAA